jgi:uncharacterized damage-inducible protein DinB
LAKTTTETIADQKAQQICWAFLLILLVSERASTVMLVPGCWLWRGKMISVEHVQLMARYNAWQNQSLYNGADRLPDNERKRDCGAFFGSIHGTLCHVLFGDQAWLHRFTGTTLAPRAKSILESTTAISDWEELKRERIAFDRVISDWAQSLDAQSLLGDHTWYSGAIQRDVTRPKWMLVTHMFNHQTHHRGQVHCLLTQAGVKPEDTDIPFMPGLETSCD